MRTIVNNLVYVMNSMLEKERPCCDGIVFQVNMDDWTTKNFDMNYCFQFMMALQGAIAPVQVKSFFIVRPQLVWRSLENHANHVHCFLSQKGEDDQGAPTQKISARWLPTVFAP
jgi:hypothetical protein